MSAASNNEAQEENNGANNSDAIYTQRPWRGRGDGERPWRARGGRGFSRGDGPYRGRGRGGDGFFQRGRGGPWRGGQQHHWEQAAPDNSGNPEQEVVELELNDDQMRIYKAKLAYVQEQLNGRLDRDDVARICH